MIVSDDYYLGHRNLYYEDDHVVSARQNGGVLIAGKAVTALCGLIVVTYNFSGACLPWHHTATVCAKCREMALPKRPRSRTHLDPT